MQLNKWSSPSLLVHMWCCYLLLTLWRRKLVHYLTSSWLWLTVQEVWQIHLSLSCSVAEEPSYTSSYPLAPGEKNRPVSLHHKLWGSGSWAGTLRHFASKNLLAHCSLACWQRLWSIVCDISLGLPRLSTQLVTLMSWGEGPFCAFWTLAAKSDFTTPQLDFFKPKSMTMAFAKAIPDEYLLDGGVQWHLE